MASSQDKVELADRALSLVQDVRALLAEGPSGNGSEVVLEYSDMLNEFTKLVVAFDWGSPQADERLKMLQAFAGRMEAMWVKILQASTEDSLPLRAFRVIDGGKS